MGTSSTSSIKSAINGSVEYLSIIKKLVKKPNLAKSKQPKAKKSEFVEANFSGTEFLTFKVKKVFIHL